MRPARRSARISSTLAKAEFGEPASVGSAGPALAGPRGGREYTLDIGKPAKRGAPGGAEGVQDTGKARPNEKRRPKAAFQVQAQCAKPARRPRYPFDGNVVRTETVWRIPRPPAMGDLRKVTCAKSRKHPPTTNLPHRLVSRNRKSACAQRSMPGTAERVARRIGQSGPLPDSLARRPAAARVWSPPACAG